MWCVFTRDFFLFLFLASVVSCVICHFQCCSVVMLCVWLRCASLAVSADAGVNTDVLLICVLWKCVFRGTCAGVDI